MNALSVPPVAAQDDKAFELLRYWAVDQGFQCSIRVGAYSSQGADNEIKAWGIVLADIAQHLSDALAAQGLGSREKMLKAVMAEFASEIGSPSSSRQGALDKPA